MIIVGEISLVVSIYEIAVGLPEVVLCPVEMLVVNLNSSVLQVADKVYDVVRPKSFGMDG